ncbi:MAG TPA: hypothetical protein VEK11_17170 [Thermoanaerobaculia bacterium]|nr:hypothetical protein [Thermoanaerobaculia bacterium]
MDRVIPHSRAEESVRDARAAYFARAGFASDGGYGDRWVKLKVRGVTVIAFPNTAARLRSVKLHDIHHVLTGYDTSWAGEAEIGAWELASGCRDHYAAWVLNFGAVAIGAVLCPRRVWAAFQRGRRSGNLYSGNFSEQLLDRTVADLQQSLDLTAP